MLPASQYNYPKNQKIDDDDGHYIVTPETDITDRCKFPSYLFLTE